MTTTLVIPQEIADEIKAATAYPCESGGVLLATMVASPSGDLRLIARKLMWVADSAYIRREPDELVISSHGYVFALGEAERLGAMALWVHTHPGMNASPRPSDKDRVVNEQLADVFRLRTGSPFYGAAIFSMGESGFTFTAHVENAGNEAISVDRLWAVGDRLMLTRAHNSVLRPLSPIFDRNIRAFGEAVQDTLGDLWVGLVGCGGTGSSVAEQLVRLGVRHLTLVDPDTLSSSNITRVYGSTQADVGQPKTSVLKRHLKRIAPDAEVHEVQSMVTLEPSARALSNCDVVFGCTDDNAGRLVLSRLSTYLVTPVIDCGVLLTSDVGGSLTGIDGRVTVLTPGAPCLICRDRIDLARATAELLTPAERLRRENEGYAPALGRSEPAVVAFTTSVASAAVSELLERLIGYGPTPRPSEVLLRIHEREISTNIGQPREGHYCHSSSNKLGAGNTKPFLGQTWPK